jgi:ribonuclease-3
MINLRAEAVAALTRRLGYSFRTPALLEQALTHPSVGEGAGQGTRTPPDNQRLEFLGDRVLGLLAAESLMRRYPEADEGDLSARLHALVDKPA